MTSSTLSLTSSHSSLPDTLSPSISSGSSESSKPKKERTIFFGNIEVLQELDKAVKGPHFKMDPLSKKEPRNLTFVRDSRIVRKDGVHLIPRRIKDPLLAGRFQSLLPESSSYYILNCKGVTGYGNGFVKEMRQQAIQAAKKFDQPFLLATTCIEGGNCFLTRNEALVGVHSVILSIIALQEQRLFHDEEIEKVASSIETPDLMFVRMARNSALYAQKRPHDDKLTDARQDKFMLQKELRELFGGESGYKKRLLEPVSKEDERTYREEAKKWQALWEKTLSVIAKELSIEQGNLIIMDQVRLHIDLDMALGPKRLLLMNNPQKSIDVLQKLIQQYSKGPICNHFNRILTHTKQDAETQMLTLKKNISKLKEREFQIVQIPGVFRDSGEERVNLLNGLFLRATQGLVFATQGASNHYDSYFLQAFEDSLSSQKLRPIFIDPLQKIFIESNGGLHCLTWEAPFVPKKKKSTSIENDKKQRDL